MFAPRTARQLAGMDYEAIIESIDWNRVLIEARGRHLNHMKISGSDICGSCLQDVLLDQRI